MRFGLPASQVISPKMSRRTATMPTMATTATKTLVSIS
jgi:hypothetical protein